MRRAARRDTTTGCHNYLPGTGLRMDDEPRDILPVETAAWFPGSDISFPIVRR
jgi:hypothetical protein